MDEATQAHLFEPYFTTKEIGKGSGLGLSTIHGIVVQSHGHIQVKSAAGAGTTFRIYLPKIEGAVSLPERIEATSDLFGTETVLVVEDEPQVRAYTSAALKAYGYHVITAENPQSHCWLLKRQGKGIDLVLTDVVMPNMNGRDLAARLAQVRPSLKILYMSGYSSDIMAHQGVLEDGLVLLRNHSNPNSLHRKCVRC